VLSLMCLMTAAKQAGAEAAPGKEKAARPCIELKRIRLSDDGLIAKKQRQKLFAKYLGQCIDPNLLKALLTDVSNQFMGQGYITTRPYLKQQSVVDGDVEISVLKGKVEQVVDAKTGKPNSRTRNAFAFQQGRVLNLRRLETSLEVMNRPPSSDVKFKIKPGKTRGGSIVAIEGRETSPYHLQLGVSGRKNLKDKNFYLTAQFSLDNPLNINDILTISYNGSRVQQQYQGTQAGELNYSFPVVGWLVELVGSTVSYRQGVSGLNNTYLAKGDTQGLRFRVSKPVLRNQTQKLTPALSIHHKNTKNYFSNQLISVSNYKTSQAQFDLSHVWLQKWGRLTSTYSFYHGLDWFGARGDGYVGADPAALNQAKLQFRKHSLDVNLLGYLSKDRSLSFSSNYHLQRSADLLYDNDKLTVGSDYTVRGYYNQNLYGNNAWYIHNDLSKSWTFEKAPALLKGFTVFAGLDYGEVACEADNPSSCGSIAGIAAGFGTQSESLTTNFVFSRPLKRINSSFRPETLFKFDTIWRI